MELPPPLIPLDEGYSDTFGYGHRAIGLQQKPFDLQNDRHLPPSVHVVITSNRKRANVGETGRIGTTRTFTYSSRSLPTPEEDDTSKEHTSKKTKIDNEQEKSEIKAYLEYYTKSYLEADKTYLWNESKENKAARVEAALKVLAAAGALELIESER